MLRAYSGLPELHFIDCSGLISTCCYGSQPAGRSYLPYNSPCIYNALTGPIAATFKYLSKSPRKEEKCMGEVWLTDGSADQRALTHFLNTMTVERS